MDNERKPVRDVSGSRKSTYRLGQLLMVLGFVAFLSNFFFFANSFGDFGNIKGQIQRQVFLSVGGIVLIFAGVMLMRVGRYGKAGSGLNLDPEQERWDKEPLNRSTGAQISDMLDEAGLGDIGSGKKEVIKIRCTHCQALNDETDKFCGQCGQPLI